MKEVYERFYEALDGKRIKEYGMCLAYELLYTWITDHGHSGVALYDFEGESLSWIGGLDVDIDEVRKYYMTSIHRIVIHENEPFLEFTLRQLRFVAEEFNWYLISKYVTSDGIWERTYVKPSEDCPFGISKFVKVGEGR